MTLPELRARRTAAFAIWCKESLFQKRLFTAFHQSISTTDVRLAALLAETSDVFGELDENCDVDRINRLASTLAEDFAKMRAV